ncbi:MAG: sigma-54 interaction domain-containing protein [Candidatus Kryptoniota bacterium]
MEMSVEEFQEKFGIIGVSQSIKEVVEIVMRIAPTSVTVLISGESGVGKEVIAKAIHGASLRSGQPMVAVNCGAIPEGILESELFGHQKGAFTGAIEARKGYFEIADGGTLFLDEVAEMPLETQVKLLRVLETGEFMRVGSSETKKVDVRVIAASNKNLEAEVVRGYFRQDLYFRLRSVKLSIPPLRERKEDIPIFVEKFASEFCQKNQINFGGFTADAMEMLVEFDWPGNVRELKNIVESVIVLEKGKEVNASTLEKYLPRQAYVYDSRNNFLPVKLNKTPEESERELILRALWEIKNDIIDLKNIVSSSVSGKALSLPEGHSIEGGDGHSLNIEEMERTMIREAIKKFHGNKKLAAEALGISPRTLYRKLKEFDIQDQ